MTVAVHYAALGAMRDFCDKRGPELPPFPIWPALCSPQSPVSYSRYMLPGRTYMVTRRCSQRQFLLKPGAVVDQTLLYCLGRAAEAFDIQLHAFIFLSNHYHLIVTDAAPEPRLPQFMHWFNLHVAKALNVHHQRSENLWSSRSYNAVHLGDEDAVLEKIVYTLTNAVAAGLVEEPRPLQPCWAPGPAELLRQETKALLSRSLGAPREDTAPAHQAAGALLPQRRAIPATRCQSSEGARKEHPAQEISAKRPRPRRDPLSRPLRQPDPKTARSRAHASRSLQRQVAAHSPPDGAEGLPPRVPGCLGELEGRQTERRLPSWHLLDAQGAWSANHRTASPRVITSSA